MHQRPNGGWIFWSVNGIGAFFFDCPLHPTGETAVRWLFLGAVGTTVLFPGTMALAAASLFFGSVWFFRNPPRVLPICAPQTVLSASDGQVTEIATNVALPAEFEDDGLWTRVSVFLSVSDVHVNRVPISGVVEKALYKPGVFRPAFGKTEANERFSVQVRSAYGPVVFSQIAGIVARRIVCELQEGDAVDAGSVYGMIKFGSRLTTYFKEGAVLVKVGQRVVAGETPIALLEPQTE